MKTIKAVPITKEGFAPFGRYVNLLEIPARVSEDFTAHSTPGELVDEPMNLGITACKAAAQFDSISMERHMLTEEPQFCGDGAMVLTVADSDPDTCPKEEDVRAFIMRPGDVAVVAKGIWHDANHGVDKDTYYYFLATNKEPDNLKEIEWVEIQPGPVRVNVKEEE